MRYILILCLLFTIGCKEEILHDLNEQEANRLVTHLHDAQIKAVKVTQPDGAWAISVPESDTSRALKYLSEARAIRRDSMSSKRKGSLLRGRDEQRFFFERALSQEIEGTLASLNGTLEARVHLNMPIKDPLLGRTLSKGDVGSGSILLIVEDYFSENKENVAKLVSGASGIPIANISVMLSQSELQRKPKLLTESVLTQATLTSQEKTQEASLLTSQSSIGIALFGLGSILVLICFFVLPRKKKAELSNIFGGIS